MKISIILIAIGFVGSANAVVVDDKLPLKVQCMDKFGRQEIFYPFIVKYAMNGSYLELKDIGGKTFTTIDHKKSCVVSINTDR